MTWPRTGQAENELMPVTADSSIGKLVLSDSALIGTDSDGSVTAWRVLSNDKFTLTADQLLVLALVIVDRPGLDEIAETAKYSRIVSELVDMGLLCRSPEPAAMPKYWTIPEALVHLRASLGFPRPALDPAASADDPVPGASEAEPEGIQLPPSTDKAGRAAALLGERRSSREVCRPVALPDLAALLHLCCDEVEDLAAPGRVHRPYPTAGGSDELAVLVIATAVGDLLPGVYRYHAARCQLLPIPDPPATAFAEHNVARARTYLGLDSHLTPAVLLIINAVWPRLLHRYIEVGMISAYCDAGALLQTMYLVAADLGLSGTAVSSLSSIRNATMLDIDPLYESQVACFALGGS